MNASPRSARPKRNKVFASPQPMKHKTPKKALAERYSLGGRRKTSPINATSLTKHKHASSLKTNSNSQLPQIVSQVATSVADTNSLSQKKTRKSQSRPPINLYNINYVINIENQIITSRANHEYVNDYYTQMVNEQIFRSQQPQPYLKNEQMPFKKKEVSPEPKAKNEKADDSRYYFRSKSFLNASRYPPLSPTKEQQIDESVDLSFVDSATKAQEPDPQYRPSTNIGKPHKNQIGKGQKREKQSYIPMSQGWSAQSDHMHEGSTALPPDSSNPAISMPRENTSPEHSPRPHAVPHLPRAKQQALVSGNTAIRQLTKNFKTHSLERINEKVAEENTLQSRQRKRRELAGEEWVKEQKGAFANNSAFEPDQVSEVDSLANKSSYGLLYKDLNSFGMQKFLDKDKELIENRRQQERLPAGSVESSALARKEEIIQEASFKQNQEFYKAVPHNLKEVEDQFKDLKAKIKLKAVKKYQEDQIYQKEEEERQRKRKEQEEQFKNWRSRQQPAKGKEKSKSPETKEPKRKPNRRPVKKPPIKRKMSLTDQYKYIDEDYDPKFGQECGLVDQITIDRMITCQRWPIPEMLMSKPKQFKLKVDSLMKECFTVEYAREWGMYRQELRQPANSMSEEDEFDLFKTDSSEEQKKKEVTKEEMQDAEMARKVVDETLLETSPFRLDSFKYFPFRQKEGQLPLRLLKVPHSNLDFILSAQKVLAEQQSKARWTRDFIQIVFEYYCQKMKAAPIDLSKYYNETDPDNIKFQLKNYNLDDQTAKAIALTIPFMHEIKEIDFQNNKVHDQISGAFLLATFCNPNIIRLNYSYQYLRGVFAKTLVKLMTKEPNRIKSLNIMGSMSNSDHSELVIRSLPLMRQLNVINIAGVALNSRSCGVLSNLIIYSMAIRELDVSHCKMSWQSTRYLIDAMNRNICVRYINLSYNDLASEAHEFAIKIASMVTRHPTLMHINVSHTNLKREEVLFITIALSTSKTILSLHITAQDLPYYERVFLRAVIAARVGFQFRNLAVRKDIRGNKEKTQLLGLADHSAQTAEMQRYLDRFREIDQTREGLDFEIHDILEELDTQESFSHIIDKAKPEDIPEDSKVGQLIQKMIQRHKEIQKQGKHVNDLYDSKNRTLKDQLEMLNGIKEYTQYNFDEHGNLKVEKTEVEETKDMFQRQKELRVERIRQKKEREASKVQNERSAGELALMFMGINQASYELLVENPMTGYMNEIVFSRILGHDDIEQIGYWTDATQCWVCQKWNKVSISVQPEDKGIFHQKIDRIENLQMTIGKAVGLGLEIDHKKQMELEELKRQQYRKEALDDNDSFIEEVPEEMEQSNYLPGEFKSGMKITGLKSFHDTKGKTRGNTVTFNELGLSRNKTLHNTQRPSNRTGYTKTEAKTEQEHDTVIEENEVEDELNSLQPSEVQSVATTIREVEKPHKNKQYDSTNPFLPIKTKMKNVEEQVTPDAYAKTVEFEEDCNLQDTFDEEAWEKQNIFTRFDMGKRKMNIRPLSGKKEEPEQKQAQQTNVAALAKRFIGMQNESTPTETDPLQGKTSVISTAERPARRKGEPWIIERMILFEGQVYKIEEEVYSDSDNSSVYTSEDSFESDPGIQAKFGRENMSSWKADSEDFDSKESFQSKNKLLNQLGKIEKMTPPSTPMADGNPIKQHNGVLSTPVDFEGATQQTPNQQTATKNDELASGTEPTAISTKQVKKTDSQTFITDPAQKLQKSKTMKEPQNPLKTQESLGLKKSPTKVSTKNDSKKKDAPVSILKKPSGVVSTRAGANRKEVFSNDPDLNFVQKNYEHRFQPRHYKPNPMVNKRNY